MHRFPQSRSHRFSLPISAADAWPLFTPLGEARWVPGWQPEMLGGREERGTAFRTRGDDGAETTWIVTTHEPTRGRIGYARLKQGSNIGLVDVECTDENGGCAVEVRYTLTPLTPAGEAFIDEFLDDKTYRAFVEGWGERIRAVLAPAQSVR